jgi:hypothetical protein
LLTIQVVSGRSLLKRNQELRDALTVKRELLGEAVVAAGQPMMVGDTLLIKTAQRGTIAEVEVVGGGPCTLRVNVCV